MATEWVSTWLASSAPWLVKFSDSYITNNTVYTYIYQYYTCVRVDHARNLSIYKSASWLWEGHVRTKEPIWILVTILLITWAFMPPFSSHQVPAWLCTSSLLYYIRMHTWLAYMKHCHITGTSWTAVVRRITTKVNSQQWKPHGWISWRGNWWFWEQSVKISFAKNTSVMSSVLQNHSFHVY